MRTVATGDAVLAPRASQGSVVEVHGHAKEGAGFGYNRVRGLNALLATLQKVLTFTAAAETGENYQFGAGAAGLDRRRIRACDLG